jgi:hypothetical protein
VWVTPGVVTRIDLTAPPHLERAVKGAGATVVDLAGPYSPMFHTLQARDPEAGTQVYLVEAMSGEDVDQEVPWRKRTERILAMAPPPRSRHPVDPPSEGIHREYRL